jgi:hypothetical protein
MRTLSILAVLTTLLASLPRTVAAGLAPTKGSQLVTAYTAGPCPILGHTDANSALVSQMVNADGTTTTFTIPPKKIFVLTDLSASTAAEPAGDTMLINAEIGSAATGNLIVARFVTVQPNGSITGEFQVPTGIAIKSGTALCIDMLNITHGGFTGFTGFVHGYFAPDK